MNKQEVAIGDPTEEDFDELALLALQELEKLKRNSFQVDRAKIRDRLRLPNAVFGYLGKLGAIDDVPSGKRDERTITEKGRQLLNEPDAWKIGSYHKAVNKALQEYGKKNKLPVESKRQHVLESRDDWQLNIWEPLRDT